MTTKKTPCFGNKRTHDATTAYVDLPRRGATFDQSQGCGGGRGLPGGRAGVSGWSLALSDTSDLATF